jgi:hypothetical protein
MYNRHSTRISVLNRGDESGLKLLPAETYLLNYGAMQSFLQIPGNSQIRCIVHPHGLGHYPKVKRIKTNPDKKQHS